MAQVSRARAWHLDVQRGPDWLFVRPQIADQHAADAPSLVEQAHLLLEQNFAHRLVLDLTDVEHLDQAIFEQLIRLDERIRSEGGMMRVCGLSPDHETWLHKAGLEGQLACYADCEAAVMGWARPAQPR